MSLNTLHLQILLSSLHKVATTHKYGFLLENGTRIAHGQGSIVGNAFPSDMDLPGKMQVFTPGDDGDACFP